MLEGWKNQKAPVFVVSGMLWPTPLVPNLLAAQETSRRNRPPTRQIVVGEDEHGGELSL
jgi:hypothetical protein